MWQYSFAPNYKTNFMASLADVFRALNALRDEGIVENYAIGDGMAALFYAETMRTYDVDVFVLIASEGLLVSLSAIYEWAERNGYETQAEHILICGVPVQFLAAAPGLESEAVAQANTLDYDGVPVAVMRPEHLAVISVLAGSGKRRERAHALFEADAISESTLSSLLQRHNLLDAWRGKWEKFNE